MKQEDKQLLLKDLCARLPYEVKCQYTSQDYKKIKRDFICTLIQIRTISKKFIIMCSDNHLDYCTYETDLNILKPYLRSMSNMTEEERNHWKCISIGCPDWDFTARALDWLNSHHFDYRGLIEKGLALEAPENMYKEI